MIDIPEQSQLIFFSRYECLHWIDVASSLSFGTRSGDQVVRPGKKAGSILYVTTSFL
jgi:hypothetical protein